jgi:hypothetical protein
VQPGVGVANSGDPVARETVHPIALHAAALVVALRCALRV